jgi:hypothetical protein
MTLLSHIHCRLEIRHQATTRPWHKDRIHSNLSSRTTYPQQAIWPSPFNTTSPFLTQTTPTSILISNGWRNLFRQTTTALLILRHRDKAGATLVMAPRTYTRAPIFTSSFPRLSRFFHSCKITQDYSTSSLIAVCRLSFFHLSLIVFCILVR